MPAFRCKTVFEAVELDECRMSNKEFRMMKFNYCYSFLRPSSFGVLRFALGLTDFQLFGL